MSLRLSPDGQLHQVTHVPVTAEAHLTATATFPLSGLRLGSVSTASLIPEINECCKEIEYRLEDSSIKF